MPSNLSGLDLHLVRTSSSSSSKIADLTNVQSILEPQFVLGSSPWIFSTPHPSLVDISLYYQLDWGNNIAAGRGLNNLTGGGTEDTNTEGATSVFNAERYPALYKWFKTMKEHFEGLPSTETKVTEPEPALKQLRDFKPETSKSSLIPTPAKPHFDLDKKLGLVPGVKVSVAPDDTGRDE